jgi:succinate dehydrogenase/fumarate reductase flavoprotein subunit
MEKDISTTAGTRRDFLKTAFGGVALAAGAMAVSGAVSGCTSEAPAQQTSTDGIQWDYETDILVLGGGTGGLFASKFAVEKGVKVIVVESSKDLAGTMPLSSRIFHSGDLDNPSQVAERWPSNNQEMARTYIENWIPLREWLTDNAPNMSAYGTGGSSVVGVSLPADMALVDEWIEFMAEGAQVLLKTHAESLHIEEDGTVIGSRNRDENGTIINIKAKETIICTSGFQGDRQMLTSFLGRGGSNVCMRTTPYNTGDGILMGLAAGGILTEGLGSFYGHPVAWPNNFPKTMADYDKVTDRISVAAPEIASMGSFTSIAIAVNKNGKRFATEEYLTYGGDAIFANAIVDQPDARAFLIGDSAQDASSVFNRLNGSPAAVLEDDTLEGLAAKIGEWGFNATNTLRTMKEYQAAAAAGANMELEIPKPPTSAGYILALNTPPFKAVMVAPGVTAPYGGLKINTIGQVLDRIDNPIKGLWAAPFAAGGIYHKEYGGGLATAATFGKIAAEHAADNLG